MFEINDFDDYGSLVKAHSECAFVLFEAIQLIKSGAAPRLPQKSINACGSTFSRRPGDEIIDWNWTSRDVFNFIQLYRAIGTD